MLNSCLSKKLSAFFNNRLNNYANDIDLISKAQAGYKRGFPMTDNIFVVHALFHNKLLFSWEKKPFFHVC